MHVVLIATQKGGAGKSTLTAHFGALADRDGKTLLVDADPQGSLAFWYKRRAAETPMLAKADANSIVGILDVAQDEGVEWALVHKSGDGRGAAAVAAFQEVRCDTGMPSRVIRLSTEQAA